jgi:hypothetical protein
MPQSRSRVHAAFVLVACVVMLTGCASTAASLEPTSKNDLDLGAMVRAHRTVPDVKLSGPLGGPENPIRAKGVQGQHDYLARLRCKNGRAPKFERAGSIGLGPYGKIVDLYTLHCENGPVQQVVMDLYHCIEETRPIEGFEIVERVIPIPNFGGCPE